MRDIVLYSHSGSKNHGCEAIVRGTAKILDGMGRISLLSHEKDEDLLYKIDEIVDVKQGKFSINKKSVDFLKAYMALKLKNDTSKMDVLQFKDGLNSIKEDSIAISIGGDTYCYSDVYNQVELHKMYGKKAYKTVLWGCSVEPKLLEDKKIAQDIKDYDLIITRESISYEALKKVNKNTYLYPDPAFQLDKSDVKLPKGFIENNTVGINLSPLVIKKENSEGITLKNYENLIEHIIQNTDMNIALIPHVVWEHNDDREPLKYLYDKFKDTNRVVMIEDANCMELKGYISKCRFFIGARTHATIAAYSTCVPTLVVGYSVKARGIAKDLFDTYDNYVLPVQSLDTKNDLLNAFKWIKSNENAIKLNLKRNIKSYKNKSSEVFKIILNMVGDK
ncbi:Polysaccharide pyruvyl transferase family protein WcaK [Intestinibacter bartlettii DSM 16795]|uniref:polysaccharide pyruvyl transferase family protein n=1 Tax=Intestinibacter bartlettii TaxID=261299 RepID=UPI000316AC34|nr:polysaccharide pyruvyl transferase family protein [Intestinibacter bartlettii]UWO80608.1 polysaccharide pyruvyl transferase family protein [Intestinibacter bartlettii]SKA58615.1 Polysaccharide pyruvyl transferase family protein WcaK [Intestinibacter bartlettii DSM 16795]